VAEREHRNRTLWIALAVGLLTIGVGSALVSWQTESSQRHIGFWPYVGERVGGAAAVVGVFLLVAVLRGWWLPGGFKEAPPDVAQDHEGSAEEATQKPAEPPQERRNRLLPGERLSAGESLYSPDGTVRCQMGRDGMLAIVVGQRSRWDSMTAQTGDANYLEFLDDGNLRLCQGDGTVLIDWRAAGMGGKVLVMQDDGNLVLYADQGRVVWASDRQKNGPMVRPFRPDLRAHPLRRLTAPDGQARWVNAW
jgi:hypothetical protein